MLYEQITDSFVESQLLFYFFGNIFFVYKYLTADESQDLVECDLK